METRTAPRARLALFIAMALFVPWPFYLIAVLSLDSLAGMAVTALFPLVGAGTPHGLGILVWLPMALLLLAQIALGAFVFDRAARALARVIERSARPGANLAVGLAFIFAVSWLPVFGGGENLLAGGVHLHSLYEQLMIAGGRLDGPGVRTVARPGSSRPATLDLPRYVIQPTAPVPITPAQLECMRAGGDAARCGVPLPGPAMGTLVPPGRAVGSAAPAQAVVAGKPMPFTPAQRDCIQAGGSPRECTRAAEP